VGEKVKGVVSGGKLQLQHLTVQGDGRKQITEPSVSKSKKGQGGGVKSRKTLSARTNQVFRKRAGERTKLKSELGWVR